MEFGDKLRELRTARGLTQTELAKLLGVNKSIISAYETQMRMPSLVLLIKIALEFSVSIDWMLGIEKTRSITAEGVTDEQVVLIINIINEFKRTNKK